MTVTNTQIFGLAAGSIPGLNFIAAPIKFVYYMSLEKARTEAASAKIIQVAVDMNQSFNNIFLKKVVGNIPNLKWYALLQIIPLVGIYFVRKEKELLEKINDVFKNSLNT